MIGISEKEAEASETERAEKHRHLLRREFWTLCLDAFRQSDVQRFNNISPCRDHWLSAGSGVSGCPFSLIFSRDEARVELILATSDKTENKRLFDTLMARKNEIEESFGGPLRWLRLDEKKSSRIECQRDFDGYNRDAWPEMIDWLVEHMRRLDTALARRLKVAASSPRLFGQGTTIEEAA